jgi:hypothetical protein
MRKSLHSTHMQELSANHWVCFVDGALVKDEELDIPAVILHPPPPLERISTTESSTNLTNVDVDVNEVVVDPIPRIVSNTINNSSTTIPHLSSSATLPIPDEDEASSSNPNSSHDSSKTTAIATAADGGDVVISREQLHTQLAHMMKEGETVEGGNLTSMSPGLLIETIDQQTNTIRKERNHEMKEMESDKEKNGKETVVKEEIFEKDFEIIPTAIVHPLENPQQNTEKKTTTSSSSSSQKLSFTEPVTATKATEQPTTTETSSSTSDSSSFPDFIRIPSFSFINGTYYLYQKVSTTLNSGMTSASETSNSFINAVTSTIQTTFSPSGMKTVETTKTTRTLSSGDQEEDEVREETKMVVIDENEEGRNEETSVTTNVHHEPHQKRKLEEGNDENTVEATVHSGMKRGHQPDNDDGDSREKVEQQVNESDTLSPNNKKMKFDT